MFRKYLKTGSSNIVGDNAAAAAENKTRRNYEAAYGAGQASPGKIKILVLTPFFFPIVGGAELFIYELCRRFSQEASVSLLTPSIPLETKTIWASDHPTEFPIDILRFDNNLTLTRIPGQRLLYGLIPPVSLSAMRQTIKVSKDLKPDLIICFYGKVFGFAALAAKRRFNCPVMMVVCGTDLASDNQLPLWRHYGRYILRKADAAIYVSEFTRSQFWKNDAGTLGNGQVIPNGVDLTLFTPKMNGVRVRERLDIKPDEMMLLAMQRLAPQKRVDIVIKSLPNILLKHPKTKLVVAGIGSETPALRALVTQLGLENKVIFTGYLGAERAEYLAAADIFVFHSCGEAFGIVLAEAMAAGKPIVTVNNSAIPEVVQDRVTGLLCRPLDPLAMAEKVIELIENPKLAQQVGAAARRAAEESYNIEAVYEQYADLAINTIEKRQNGSGHLNAD